MIQLGFILGQPKLIYFTYLGIVRNHPYFSHADTLLIDGSFIYEIILELFPVLSLTLNFLFYQFGPRNDYYRNGNSIFTNSLESSSSNWQIWASIIISIYNIILGIYSWNESKNELNRIKYKHILKKRPVYKTVH